MLGFTIMASESGITSRRQLAPGSLVVAPELEALFPTNEVAPLLSERIAVDGFDPHRPIDAWTDGAGRGRHVVLEGHTRLQAAKHAGVAAGLYQTRRASRREAEKCSSGTASARAHARAPRATPASGRSRRSWPNPHARAAAPSGARRPAP